jgi:NDP-sugar pyrophosphorylase family protein
LYKYTTAKPKQEPKLGSSSTSYQAKINMIMYPNQSVCKDQVKLAAFIDTDHQNYFMKMHNLKYYMVANQDAQRLQGKSALFSGLAPSDLLSSYKTQIEENKRNKVPIFEGLPPIVKQVGLESSVGKDIELGEKASVTKSCIGRGVKIGARSKILNSVILNHVAIGNE